MVLLVLLQRFLSNFVLVCQIFNASHSVRLKNLIKAQCQTWGTIEKMLSRLTFMACRGLVRLFTTMMILLNLVLLLLNNNMLKTHITIWIWKWVILIMRMMKHGCVMKSNTKTRRGGVSGNIIPRPNMARLTDTTLELAQVVKNLWFSPCWKICVLSNRSATKRTHIGVTLFEVAQEEHFILVHKHMNAQDTNFNNFATYAMDQFN